MTAYRPTLSIATLCRVPTLLAVGLAILPLALAPPATAEAQAGLAYGEGLLWRIETDGRPPSYLFGTIHLTDTRVTKLPPPVVKTAETVDSLTLEIIMDEDTQEALQSEIWLTGDRSLEDILGSDLYADALRATQSYGMIDGILRTLEPWAVLGLLSTTPEETVRMAMGHLTVDGTLQQIAFDRGIQVHALETVQEQTEVLSDMSEADMIMMVRDAIDLQPEIDSMIDEMIGFYLALDLSGLHARLLEMSAGDDPALLDRFMDRVIDRRNLLMADRMADRLTEGNALVAVGALHLPGESGILSLLEQRGHAITRIH